MTEEKQGTPGDFLEKHSWKIQSNGAPVCPLSMAKQAIKEAEARGREDSKNYILGRKTGYEIGKKETAKEMCKEMEKIQHKTTLLKQTKFKKVFETDWIKFKSWWCKE